MTEENKNTQEENKVENAADANPATEAKEAPKAEAKPAAETKTAEEPKADAKAEEAKANGEPRKPSADPNKATIVRQDQKGEKASRKSGHGGKRRRSGRDDRRGEEQSEYVEKVVQVRRVTKVVKGGKKLSFRAVVVLGNEKGKVGVGVGKAAEVLTAIKKAISDGRKHLIDVPTVGTTISHSVIGEAGGSKILLRPAADGTGVIAGGTARIVLELAGVGDVLAKSQGSKSPLNVARATIEGLQSLRSFQEVARERGISVKEMLF